MSGERDSKNKKNQTKKVNKKTGKENRENRVNKEDKEKKEDRVNKENKEKKEDNSVEKLLEKISVDAVIDAMAEHKWLVAKTIAMYIIGEDVFDNLSDIDKQIIIKRVNEIKLKTTGLA